MKKKDNVSEKLVEYIKQNNISIEQISKDTGVSALNYLRPMWFLQHRNFWNYVLI